MENPSKAGTVKSADRVLRVLEHFASTRSPATVKEVSLQLAIPQSSTSVLLTSMEGAGYLAYEPETRTYRPTIRVLLLDAWMQDEIFGEGSIIAMMTSLRGRPRQSVMLGLRQGLYVRYLLSLRSAERLSTFDPTGLLRPVCVSAIGKVLLAQESERRLALIVRQANRVVEADAHRVDEARWLAEIRRVRKLGWAECRNYPYPGLGGIAIALPRFAHHPPLAVSIGVTLQRLDTERDSLVEQLLRARAEFIGA